jgi:hypothetical protein
MASVPWNIIPKDSEATMPAPISAKSVMDSRGTKFIIMTEYPPEKQKMMEDKLFEEAAKHGIEPCIDRLGSRM